MKIVTTFTLGITFLLAISFLFLQDSEARVGSNSGLMQPTPLLDKPIKEVSAPRMSCSPQRRPLSEAEQNDPLREDTAEEALDGLLGSEDVDCDGICNRGDNCVLVYNPDQKDSDNDGYANACDPKLVDKSFTDLRCDMDGDGIPDTKDNCPLVCNPDQKFTDINKNRVNDLCDNTIPSASREKLCTKRIMIKAPKPPRPLKQTTK
jgi:hypothetical protein